MGSDAGNHHYRDERRLRGTLSPLPCRVLAMIDRIIVENFKSLRRIDLTLGRMNLFVGANASGKSNFLDLLRVLQGIGNGFTISEILDGKPPSATSTVWAGIRGGSRLACFAGAGADRGDGAVTVEAHGRFGDGPGWPWYGMKEWYSESEPASKWKLLITFSPPAGCVNREYFQGDDGLIYDTDDVELRPEEIDDVAVLRGAMHEPLFVLKENGREFPRRSSATAPCALRRSPPRSSSRICLLSQR